jgi:hypothetical protein
MTLCSGLQMSRVTEESHKSRYDRGEFLYIVITLVITYFVVIDTRFLQTKELKKYICLPVVHTYSSQLH